MRLDAPGIELRVRIAYDMACQQHADGFAADAAGADLAALDLHQVPHREVAAAEVQALGFGAQQAAEDVLFQGDAVGVGGLGVVGADRVEHAVPAVAPLAGLGEDVKDGIGVAAGGDGLAARAGNAEREEHVFGGPSAGLDRVDVGAAVQRPDVQQHRGGMPDARDRLVDMPLVPQGHVAQRAPGGDELAGQAEEIADHQVREPVALQVRQTVKQEEAVLGLGRDDAVDLHGKGFKADGGVQLNAFDVGAPRLQ